MSGNGPPPKRPDQRRRRNQPAAGDWVFLPVEGYAGPIPTLPKGFEKSTVEWWKQIWRTPMATQWTAGDIPALVELAALRERLVEYGKVSVAPEVRLRSDQFGLTPKGRQERRWIITDEDAARAGVEAEDELAARRAARRQRLEPKVGAKKTTRRKTTKAPAKKKTS